MSSLPSPWSSSAHPEGCQYNLELRVLNTPPYFLEELEKFLSINNTVPGGEVVELMLQLDEQVAGSYLYYLIQSPDDGALTEELSLSPFPSISHRQGGLYWRHVESSLCWKDKRELNRLFASVFPLSLTQALARRKFEDHHQAVLDASPLKRHWSAAAFKLYVSRRYTL